MRIPTRKNESDQKELRQQDNYLTTEAIERMKKTVERLKSEQPALSAEVARTQAMGDLSENAAYQTAKYNLRRNMSRVDRLQERIKYAIPIDTTPDSSGKIKLGSTVTLRLGDNEFAWQILGEQEADPAHGKISYKSPIGAALLGHVAGDEVEVDLGERVVEYEIVEVR